jgi:hypothetical protein
MNGRITNRSIAPIVALGLSGILTAACTGPGAPPEAAGSARHVLLISVDGMHQSDLSAYIGRHPDSAFAGLVRAGIEYTHASTPVPSDSFPGMTAQVTGGNPASTGVYYDSAYDRSLLPPGTSQCTGAKPGTDLVADESIDRNSTALDAGQGLPNLPDGILSMTDRPSSVINPAALPVDPASCRPVFPHQFLRVNTVFEVAHDHGLRTAWSDKHPAYDLLTGPSGTGIDDLFTPEINSKVVGGTGDWTSDTAATQRYDAVKVTAVRNEIDGYDHSRTRSVGVPAILGLNFQSVSAAQKLSTSGGAAGGYLADGVMPGPVLAAAFDFVDQQLGALLGELRSQHLDQATTVVLSAKHGQGPTNPALLNRIDDGPILDGLNAAWQAIHPGGGPLIAHAADDDAMLLWLTDRSPAATDLARQFLLGRSGTGTGIAGEPKPYTRSGLDQLLVGSDAASYFHTPVGDSRVPDVVGLVVAGVVYTSGTAKIAEHGGASPSDRNVPIVVVSPGETHPGVTADAPVETTQIAPTVLHALGLDPDQLAAVRAEHTLGLATP